MYAVVKRLAIAAAIVLLPSLALAQCTLTGTVKDASGAVLPGVTVEASSPALIEKTKAAVTDGSGQYRIIDLRPGTYSLTFTLPGFNTVKRDNVELSGTQTLTIAAEMKVGGLEETITVTGETPVVDVQNARKETIIKSDVIEALPVTRAAGAILNVTPGIQVAESTGGALPDDDRIQCAIEHDQFGLGCRRGPLCHERVPRDGGAQRRLRLDRV